MYGQPECNGESCKKDTHVDSIFAGGGNDLPGVELQCCHCMVVVESLECAASTEIPDLSRCQYMLEGSEE